MIALKEIKHIYFIGVGGIGMSALARYFKAKGATVAGYDKTSTVLTRTLEAEGIHIHYDDNMTMAPAAPDVVVYTPAIPAHHTELNYYRNHGFTVVKRSDILQWITANSFNICVAGTHGKTTVSSMIAHVLRDTGYGCNAFLGGIAANYNSNFWSHENNVVVVEADEYDRSFLKLSPDIAIVTAMDPDHLDIYGTAEEVEKAFVQFSQKVKQGGCLITKYGLSKEKEFTVPDHCTYDLNNSLANIHVNNLVVENGSYRFDVVNNYWTITDVVLNMGGLHNIENVLVAIGVAKYLKIDDAKIKSAVASFKGVKRRFEYALKTAEHTVIDDYAHHPEELNALISGVRSLYPNTKLTLVFQPHLFSRTKDQATGFATSLAKVDELILLPIYPARELPMEGITSEWLLAQVQMNNKQVMLKDDIVKYIDAHQPELVVMAGAGDIDTLVAPIAKLLS
jgi:UDP-N-acetylmuramate--alanine ligase